MGSTSSRSLYRAAGISPCLERWCLGGAWELLLKDKCDERAPRFICDSSVNLFFFFPPVEETDIMSRFEKCEFTFIMGFSVWEHLKVSFV